MVSVLCHSVPLIVPEIGSYMAKSSTFHGSGAMGGTYYH